LGKGGMGRVYKVLDKEVNAKVALKLIKPEIASDKKTIERFRNELKVARDIARWERDLASARTSTTHD